MPYYRVSQPFEFFFDIDGTPLEDGYIYIGESDENPITNPITIYWDNEGVSPATQPIRTTLGFPSNNGTPANLYIDYTAIDSYSIIIKDKNGVIVYNNISSDISDYTDSTLTFTIDPILNNEVYFNCKEVGGTSREVLGFDSSDILQLGNVNNATNILSNGTLTHNGVDLSVLTTWEENGNNFRPTSSGVGHLGDTTHLIAGIYMGDNAYLYFGDDQDMQIHHNGVNGIVYVGDGDLYIGTVDADNFILTTNNVVRWVFNYDGNFVPYGNNLYNIGSPSERVATIYSTNALDVSDFRYKTDITPLNIGLEFINSLNPVSFKLLEAGDDRSRCGLIAQQVDEMLSKFGLGYEDFSGIHYDKKTDRWDMDYKQFIAPLIKAVQELAERIENL